MIAKLKLLAYVVLSGLAVWFALGMRANYAKVIQIANTSATNDGADLIPVPDPASTNQNTTAAGPTNIADLSTNLPSATNESIGSNVVQHPAASNAPPAKTAKAAAPSVTSISEETRQGKLMGNLLAFVGTMIGLGLLVAYDVTHYMGGRAVAVLFNDEGEGMRDPEYERAEAVWANGKPLEAVEMMREYLKKNPREQHVAIRIAEIYEKDLHNYVAASLEYEEILKKRLRPERWGWAAIHLCNIYSRIGKQEKVKPLLERIAQEYPKTGAARKARRNLGLPEEEAPVAADETPEPTEEADPSEAGHVFDLDEVIAATDEKTAAPPPDELPPEAPPKSDLPPGFRPKKK